MNTRCVYNKRINSDPIINKITIGVYEKNNQYININRGFGFLAYPGRVGIYPEISVIQLQSETT